MDPTIQAEQDTNISIVPNSTANDSDDVYMNDEDDIYMNEEREENLQQVRERNGIVMNYIYRLKTKNNIF